MSSNGLLLFFLLSVAGVFFPSSAVVPTYATILTVSFALSRDVKGPILIGRALLNVSPIVAFLAIVWTVLVGRAPDTTLFYRPIGATSPWQAVAAIGTRLFLVSLITFVAADVGRAIKPSFVSGLAAPKPIKALMLATEASADMMRQGAQRAHTALVAANVLTGRFSVRNLKSFWLLLRTTWVASVGIAAERLDTKWLLENLPDSAPLVRRRQLTRSDFGWLTAALVALAAAATGLGE